VVVDVDLEVEVVGSRGLPGELDVSLDPVETSVGLRAADLTVGDGVRAEPFVDDLVPCSRVALEDQVEVVVVGRTVVADL
jgi:hypothetical protein